MKMGKIGSILFDTKIVKVLKRSGDYSFQNPDKNDFRLNLLIDAA